MTNNKTYIFLSKILSSSILFFIKLINFFHQNYLMFFINSRDKKIHYKFFTGQSSLSISYEYWHSINLAYNRTYTRGLSRTHCNIYNTAFLWFSQGCPIVDVLLGSKYASAYIYIRVSPIEIILHIILSILDIFAVKYLFSYKGRNVSNWLNRIQLVWFILPVTLSRSNLTQTHFLAMLKKV